MIFICIGLFAMECAVFEALPDLILNMIFGARKL